MIAPPFSYTSEEPGQQPKPPIVKVQMSGNMVAVAIAIITALIGVGMSFQTKIDRTEAEKIVNDRMVPFERLVQQQNDQVIKQQERILDELQEMRAQKSVPR